MLNLSRYIAHRIEGNHLDYVRMIHLYPKRKEEIDRILIEEGYAYLIADVDKTLTTEFIEGLMTEKGEYIIAE